MPVIEVTMGKSSKEQKRELIQKFTAVAVEITKIPESEFTILIHELEYDSIGRAGKTVAEILAARNA